MKLVQKIHLVFLPHLLLAMAGCALPEGAITVNKQISHSLQEQQKEVERALKWAVRPYYQQLEARRPAVLNRLLLAERRTRAIDHWRTKEISAVWAQLKDGQISGELGTAQIETLRAKAPDSTTIAPLTEETALPHAVIDAVSKAVDAKYNRAKSELDAEVNKVIAVLRTNSQNIIAANDKISQALEKQRHTRLEVIKVVQTGLTIAAPKLAGLDVFTTIVEQFGGSGTASRETGQETGSQ